jgi:hypothetical protein
VQSISCCYLIYSNAKCRAVLDDPACPDEKNALPGQGLRTVGLKIVGHCDFKSLLRLSRLHIRIGLHESGGLDTPSPPRLQSN